MNITLEQYRAMQAPKPNKYRAVKAYRCEPCGAAVECTRPCLACGEVEQLRFDSQGEAKRYDVLRRLESLGHIHGLECQPKYPININGGKLCDVVLDFRYLTKTGQLKIEDFKGKDNAMSRLKRKAFKLSYGLEVEVVR